MNNKKGFTLIELMIVLAIIAILAVVLIPKASIFKSQAKNSGILTNQNAIRAYLETKTETSFVTSANLTSALGTAFTGTDALTNPLDGTTTAYSVITAAPTTTINGCVYILVNDTAKTYTIYGIDNSGTKINETTIK